MVARSKESGRAAGSLVRRGFFALSLGLLLAALPLGTAGAQENLPQNIQDSIKEKVTDAVRQHLTAQQPEPPPPIQNGVPFALRFDSQVRGLAPGASVEIKGIRIGEVRSIDLSYDQDRNAFDVFVTLVLQPSLFPAMGNRPSTPEETYDAVAELVERGLRAHLASQQLIGGSLVVDLDIQADATAASLDRTHEPPMIPTGPSRAEVVKERLQALIRKVTDLPLEPLVEDAKASLLALKALVEGPELKEALANLRDSTAEIEAFMDGMDGRMDSIVAQINATSASAGRMLDQAGETLVSVQRSIGDRSPILTDIRKLLREFEGAARSLRLMADYLERHPDALLRGKRDDRQ